MEQGVLLRRYKRFLADVEFLDGRIETVHCANTGAMTQCSTPGSLVWCSVSESKTRKYPRSLEVVIEGENRVVVNTARANELIGEALSMRLLAPFQEYVEVIPEARAPDGHSRFDFLLRGPALTNCYVEVKNVTWQRSKGKGLFPDAKSARAGKHVEDLVKLRRSGERAALVFCVQHGGIETVSTAAEVDPRFAELLNVAVGDGVEVYGYKTQIELDSLTILSAIPISVE